MTTYPVLNVREGSHDPWPELVDNRPIDPYRHDLVVRVVADLAERLSLDDPLIADFGCGDGVTLGRLHDAGFRRLLAVDHSEVGLERARGKAPDAVLIRADLTTMEPPAGAGCDIAICTEVLEHLPHDDDVARTMGLVAAALNPSGWAVISVPDDSICGIDDDHRRLFTPDDPRRLLEAAGFVDVEEIRYHYSAAYPWPWMTAIGRKP